MKIWENWTLELLSILKKKFVVNFRKASSYIDKVLEYSESFFTVAVIALKSYFCQKLLNASSHIEKLSKYFENFLNVAILNLNFQVDNFWTTPVIYTLLAATHHSK